MFIDNSHSEAEATVNQWLENQANIQVKQVIQFYCDNNNIPWITLTVVYETPALEQ